MIRHSGALCRSGRGGRIREFEIHLEILRRIVFRGRKQSGSDQKIDDPADVGGAADPPFIKHLIREHPDQEIFMDGDAYAIVARARTNAYIPKGALS